MVTKNKNPGQAGSLIVEAAIVYPIIFFVLFALFMFIIGLYKNAYAQSVADMTVRKGSQFLRADAYSDMSLKTDNGVYSGFSSSPGERSDIERFALNQLESNPVTATPYYDQTGNSYWLVDATEKNYIVYRELNVTIYSRFRTGIPFVDTVMGYGKGFAVYVQAASVVNDSAEFIRNVDLAGDILMQFPIFKKK